MARSPGTVRLVAGRWIGRAVLRIRDPATGQARRRDVRARLGTVKQLRTEAAALREFDRHLERLNLRRVPACGGTTFRNFVARRFEAHMVGFSANTAARYRSELRKHLVPALGELPLAGIDVSALQDVVTQFRAAGMRPCAIAGLIRLAIRVLAVAADEGAIAAAPDVRRLALPRDDRPPAPPRAFTHKDVVRVLTVATGWRQTLFALLAFSGLRIGEGLGIEWPDIDFAKGTLRVRQQSARGCLVRLKSRTSAATLPISKALCGVLAAYHIECGSPAEGLLFPGLNGAPRSSEGVRKALRRILAELGIRQAGCHAFRHYYVARLAASGAPLEAVRRLARHSNYSLTLRYSQAFPAIDLRAAVERMSTT